MIDRNKYIPLYIQLRDELAQKIKDGVWETESQIPTERELMEEYNIGRATVREAVNLLVNEGYLYKKQGVGTFVGKRQPFIAIEPLISLTYPLEAMDIHLKNIILKKEIIIPDKHLLAAMKWKREKPCFYLERTRYADEKVIAIEQSFFHKKFEEADGTHDLTGSLARIIIKDMNLTVRKVEQVIVPRFPTEGEQRELGIDSSTAVFNLERWIYTEDGDEPFYYLKFIIPSNRFYFSF